MAPPAIDLLAGAEPYVGPRPFARADAARFFGRDGEAEDLASLVLAHRALVLYAPSGAGKSSLLEARVLPMLGAPERGALVLGPARVSGELPEAEVANVFAYHALVSLGVDEAAARRGELADHVEALAREHALAHERPVVLVLDQFEELFTRHPERWRERAPFFAALGEASERLPSLRILLSMREEHLAQLVPFARFLPESLRGRFRLERLRREAALDAIVKPLDGFGRRFAPGAAQRLVDSLMRVPVQVGGETREVEGEFVEPVHLQVVCQRLWRSLPADATEIDERAIDTRGGVDDALGGYFDECIARIASETGESEGRLRGWTEDALITSEGTRSLVHKGTHETAGLANEVVERMEASHLLRAELRGGGTFFELAHDRFLGPVRRSNRRFRERQMASYPALSTAEARAREWADAGRAVPKASLGQYLARSQGDVLRELRSLAEVERNIEPAAAAGLEPSAELREYLRVHREAYRVVAERFQGAAILALFLLACGLFGGVLYALDLKEDAELAQNDAVAAREEAEQVLERERGRLASEFAKKRGRELDALELGLRAVAPALAQKEAPPREAEAGLRAAVANVVARVPLWTSRSATARVAIDPSGRAAAAWNAHSLCVFDARTGELRGEWDAPDESGLWLSGVVPRSNGSQGWALLARRDRGLQTPDVFWWQTPNQVALPDSWVRSVDSEIRLLDWSAGGPRQLGAPVTLAESERVLLADPEHERVYLAGDERVRIVSLDGGRREGIVDLAATKDVVTSADGNRCILVADGVAQLVDPRDGSIVASVPGAEARNVSFSPDSRAFAVGLANDCVLYSSAAGEVIARGDVDELSTRMEWFGYLSRGEALLALRSEGGASRSSVAIWLDAATARSSKIDEYPGPLLAVARRPERFLVAGSGGGWGAIWDPESLKLEPLGEPLDPRASYAVDARVEAIVITPSEGSPELIWPERDARVPDDLDAVVGIACDRLRGRPEYAVLVAEIESVR